MALPVPVIASNFEFFYKQGVLMSEKKKKTESMENVELNNNDDEEAM